MQTASVKGCKQPLPLCAVPSCTAYTMLVVSCAMATLPMMEPHLLNQQGEPPTSEVHKSTQSQRQPAPSSKNTENQAIPTLPHSSPASQPYLPSLSLSPLSPRCAVPTSPFIHLTCRSRHVCHTPVLPHPSHSPHTRHSPSRYQRIPLEELAQQLNPTANQPGQEHTSTAADSATNTSSTAGTSSTAATAAPGQLYDVVMASEVIEHVKRPDLFIKTLATVVAPGGTLIMSTVNRTPAAYAITILAAEYLTGIVPR